MISTNIPLKRNTQIAFRIIDNQAVLVEPAAGAVNVLNETGSLIWQLIDGRHTGADLAECLEEKYGLEQATALADTSEFLAAILAKGWIRYADFKSLPADSR